jgi:hypothetical protein
VAWHAVAQLPANSTSYRDVDVTVDVIYRYAVRAKRDDWSYSESNGANAAIATVPPAAPGGVHPISCGSTAVGITWGDYAEQFVDRGPDERGAGVLSRDRLQRQGRLLTVGHRLHGATRGTGQPHGDGGR